MSRNLLWFATALAVFGVFEPVFADETSAPKSDQSETDPVPDPAWYSLHAQATFTDQGHPSFAHSAPDGPQSLASKAQNAETTDVTLFMGLKIENLELYANPEMDQGFGLSDTYGVAGFPSGEAYKVGEHDPYFTLPRAFGRYVVDLGGERQDVADGPNQVAGSADANNLTFTFGKFSVVDIFDNNAYAHDPRSDFFNWSMIDMGAFDYAANAWGYTYGGTAEWNQDWWTLRAGLFDMSRQPNDKYLVRGLGQNQAVFEAEERHTIGEHPGKVRALFFLSSADMASYDDALALASVTGSSPDVSLVRRRQVRPGGGLNFEQELTSDVGAFLRASMNDGTKEAFEFSEINQSLSGGLSWKGTAWEREDDTIGLGGALNGISSEARQYLAAGGMGIVIGDGQLPSYAAEDLIEAYYKATLVKGVALTFDYQCAIHPAYNADRGPIHLYGVRLHTEY